MPDIDPSFLSIASLSQTYGLPISSILRQNDYPESGNASKNKHPIVEVISPDLSVGDHEFHECIHARFVHPRRNKNLIISELSVTTRRKIIVA